MTNGQPEASPDPFQNVFHHDKDRTSNFVYMKLGFTQLRYWPNLTMLLWIEPSERYRGLGWKLIIQ